MPPKTKPQAQGAGPDEVVPAKSAAPKPAVRLFCTFKFRKLTQLQAAADSSQASPDATKKKRTAKPKPPPKEEYDGPRPDDVWYLQDIQISESNGDRAFLRC